MQRIYIKEETKDTILYIDNDKFDGIIFYKNNQNKKVDETIFENFKYFLLSNNHKKIDNEDDYEVYMDNETGLKHYFKNQKEDFEMLFLNNGKLAILENKDDNIKNILKNKLSKISKSYIFKKENKESITIIILCGTLIAICAKLSESDLKFPFTRAALMKEQIEKSITVDDIKNMIYSSERLTEEEKDFIYNEKFCEDALSYIKNDDESIYILKERLDQLDIQEFDENYDKDNVSGYVDYSEPNVIRVKNYEKISGKNKDTVAHENMHLYQCDFSRNVIKEACAEILSKEYYPDVCKEDAYKMEVRLVKILMEIIGTHPILEYNFNGNFNEIESQVKSYLSINEYKDFYSIITSFDEENRTENNIKLRQILKTLYQNKYNDDINNNEIIVNIYRDNICRFYFNDEYINEENSYINNVSTIMSIDEALKEKYICYEIKIQEEITKEEVISLLTNNSEKYKNYDEVTIAGVESKTKDIIPVSLEDLDYLDYSNFYINATKTFGYDDFVSKEYEKYDYVYSGFKPLTSNVEINDYYIKYMIDKKYVPTIKDNEELNVYKLVN